ncbi:LacI family DNA-binding transcriptional regulator [Lactobacillus sp. ESL0680]|uniref:LacI family DNA-binding transcriptional regulator n=1 Tax=Lactobacillus sp. ESL0680 TaxID=2983210 RepID=UPI0023F91DD2|nr:LacI family DNA-binding transcriptional regulator [Lactobacillus sp. ESL0680]WEV38646.1 LacI family DNA-binding transcriptional regulator [Lactobacillus sp. ESL0680]
MTTIKEIAELSGCSVSTVSRVLNHHPYVSLDKRQKIQAVIQKTGYHPNRIAQDLNKKKTNSLGVIVPYLDEPYFEKVTAGICRNAIKHNYKISILPTYYDRKIEMNYFEEFASKLYDGLIVTSKANEMSDILPYIRYGSVIFCEKIDFNNISCIYIDRSQAFKELFKYFTQKGLRHLGLTSAQNQHKSSSTKLLFQIAKQDFPAFKLNHVFENCATYQDGINAGKYFMNFPEIDGIFANGDEIAAGIIHAYQKEGLQPPLIVGQDNTLISKIMNFPSIDTYPEKYGEEIFQHFIKKNPEHINIDAKFVKR